MRHANKLIVISCCILAALWAAQAPVERSRASVPGGYVTAWGNNDSGQRDVPAGLSDVIAVSAGGAHSLALKADGTVVGWGSNTAGAIDIPAGLSGVSAISAGMSNHSLALKSDGTVVAWGQNNCGEANVPDGLSDVIAVAAGNAFSLALKSDGTVTAWGDNCAGQITVPDSLTGVSAISASDHALALKSDGTVVAWGRNDWGQANIPAGLSNVIAIAAGGVHSLALKSDGTVVGWGYDGDGQSTVPADLTGVTRIAAGVLNSFALKTDGTVIAWGNDSLGQLSTPAGLSGVTNISAGGSYILAITTNVFSTQTPSPTKTPTKTKTLTKSKTPTRTRTYTSTPSGPTRTRSKTPRNTRTPTNTPEPIIAVQSEKDGSVYTGGAKVRYSSGGEVFVKVTNNTNRVIDDLAMQYSQGTHLYYMPEEGGYSRSTYVSANCFDKSHLKLNPHSSRIFTINYQGRQYVGDTAWSSWDNWSETWSWFWRREYTCFADYSYISTNQYVILQGVYSIGAQTQTFDVPISFEIREDGYQTPTITHTPTRTPTPHPPVLRNPLFESGSTNWTSSTTSNASIIQRIPAIARSGDWLAIFGGSNRESATLLQAFYVLPTQNTLTFWYKITSSERCGFSYDTVRVLIDGVAKWQLDACTYQASSRWQQASVSLPPGRNTSVTFEMHTNASNPSTWFVDDVAVR